MKKILIAIGVVVASVVVYFIIQNASTSIRVEQEREDSVVKEVDKSPLSDKDDVVENIREGTESPLEDVDTQTETQNGSPVSVIGTSVEGRDITAYQYGTGEKELLFIGGTHGGYSWNTASLAYKLMDYLEENKSTIPESIKITVIPVLNPDGLYKVTGAEGEFTASDITASESEKVASRFNANEVDLNRNFDCNWKSEGVWKNTKVDAGTEAFSEPESKALKGYIEANNPEAVVVWYSSAGGVYSSSCYNGVMDETEDLTNVYADASGYQAFKEFDFYTITGDMVNWFAKKSIPAISVLLTSPSDIEWSKNKAGVDAVIKKYSE